MMHLHALHVSVNNVQKMQSGLEQVSEGAVYFGHTDMHAIVYTPR